MWLSCDSEMLINVMLCFVILVCVMVSRVCVIVSRMVVWLVGVWRECECVVFVKLLKCRCSIIV